MFTPYKFISLLPIQGRGKNGKQAMLNYANGILLLGKKGDEHFAVEKANDKFAVEKLAILYVK